MFHPFKAAKLSNIPQALLPRQGHTADIIGDSLFVFGGFDLNNVLSDFSRLDILSREWSAVHVDSSCLSIPAGELSGVLYMWTPPIRPSLQVQLT